MKAGQIAKLPRLFVAQPLNCSPIDASFQAGVDTPVPREVRKTVAEGTAIKHPMRLREIIAALRESGGGTVALTEDEIVSRCAGLPGRACSPSPLRERSGGPGQTVQRRRHHGGREHRRDRHWDWAESRLHRCRPRAVGQSVS